jgi:hypothetical protein
MNNAEDVISRGINLILQNQIVIMGIMMDEFNDDEANSILSQASVRTIDFLKEEFGEQG